MKPPFPWFGGKSRVADLSWQLLGDVQNYVEPFAGSLAILLNRPHEPKIETVNDKDCYLSNFWRAVKNDPDGVAEWCDWPVNEADLHARHLWLVRHREEFQELMKTDPEHFDVKVAGWWVWGICQWIGAGWCSTITRRLPHLGCSGMGVHRQIPHLGDAGKGVHLTEYMNEIAARLRSVRVCCGDFLRVLGPTPTFIQGLTGVVLDPPYSLEADREMSLYAEECGKVANLAREWAIANGDHPKMRVLLFGYQGEHDHEMPEGWVAYPWKTRGGYGNQSKNGRGRANAMREVIWASPYCLHNKEATLFDEVFK